MSVVVEQGAARLERPQAAGTVILLGPQHGAATLGDALAAAGIHGKLATVTSGWEEREDEVDELREHVGDRCVALRLFRRAEGLYRRIPELDELRQEHLSERRQLRRLYGVRLRHLFDTWEALDLRRESPVLVADQRASLMQELRRLDAEHLQRIDSSVAEYRHQRGERFGDTLHRHRREIRRLLDRCEAIAIAGGNVGTLQETLELFEVGAMLDGRAAIGWSAGAMALTERVVLYHDSPPQGVGNPEVMARGLGRAGGIVALPHASSRLRLDDPVRTARLAERFAPAVCLALDPGAWVMCRDDCWLQSGARAIDTRGAVEEVSW